MIKTLTLLAALALLPIVARADEPTYNSPPSAGVSIDDRPPVALVLMDKLMSGHSREGQIVHYRTLAGVYGENHELLIPAGSTAVGRVTRSKGSGMFGKRGQLQFTCDYIVLPDNSRVRLVGSRQSAAGTNDTAATVAVTILVSPLGLFIKGGTVVYDPGTLIEMYVADASSVTPTSDDSPPLIADFAFRDHHAPDVVGGVTRFDGDTFMVKTDTNGRQAIPVKDVSSVSIEDSHPDAP